MLLHQRVKRTERGAFGWQRHENGENKAKRGKYLKKTGIQDGRVHLCLLYPPFLNILLYLAVKPPEQRDPVPLLKY